MEQLVSAREGLLAVIIPAYNEEKCVEEAYTRISELLNNEKIEHTFVFLDDGSTDDTYKYVEELAEAHDNVCGISFSRNFGKESAIYAGLSKANEINADCAVVIDCDLQHPPEKIIEMYRLWQEGYEIVEGVKTDRGAESSFHRLSAGIFYSIISSATKIDMNKASDFKLLDSKAVLTILNMKEKNSFFRALSSWIGFKTAKVEFEVQDRQEGKSKWSVRSLIKYAINNIAAFTAAPMQIVTVLGVLVCVVSVVLGAVSLVQKFMGQALEGFTTVIILQLLTSSFIMISLGIIGYYISKIYEEVKNRPKYIVSKTCGGKLLLKNDGNE